MYQQLSVEDGEGPHHQDSIAHPPKRHSRTIPALVLVIIVETAILLAEALHREQVAVPKLYTPVHGVLEDVIQVFRYNETFLQDPSPALDEAWDNLQKYSKLRLPRSEAMLFPNKTSGIARDPGYCMAELELSGMGFPGSQLMGVQNQIRQALHPTYYPNRGVHPFSPRMYHIDHCVERIRQEIMCNVDTSVLVWELVLPPAGYGWLGSAKPPEPLRPGDPGLQTEGFQCKRLYLGL
ncbi:hypothetical protein DFH06DRAFT_1136505 [Mycena polygramma]|nr:hypothetical protein DFH06DRAFT_1136505 [Mycena polygramma]